MTSWNVNIEGLNIPFRATSIIPLEDMTPRSMPTDATESMTFIPATLEPMAELRKLTASLVTPT